MQSAKCVNGIWLVLAGYLTNAEIFCFFASHLRPRLLDGSWNKKVITLYNRSNRSLGTAELKSAHKLVHKFQLFKTETTGLHDLIFGQVVKNHLKYFVNLSSLDQLVTDFKTETMICLNGIGRYWISWLILQPLLKIIHKWYMILKFTPHYLAIWIYQELANYLMWLINICDIDLFQFCFDNFLLFLYRLLLGLGSFALRPILVRLCRIYSRIAWYRKIGITNWHSVSSGMASIIINYHIVMSLYILWMFGMWESINIYPQSAAK